MDTADLVSILAFQFVKAWTGYEIWTGNEITLDTESIIVYNDT